MCDLALLRSAADNTAKTTQLCRHITKCPQTAPQPSCHPKPFLRPRRKSSGTRVALHKPLTVSQKMKPTIMNMLLIALILAVFSPIASTWSIAFYDDADCIANVRPPPLPCPSHHALTHLHRTTTPTATTANPASPSAPASAPSPTTPSAPSSATAAPSPSPAPTSSTSPR